MKSLLKKIIIINKIKMETLQNLKKKYIDSNRTLFNEDEHEHEIEQNYQYEKPKPTFSLANVNKKIYKNFYFFFFFIFFKNLYLF